MLADDFSIVYLFIAIITIAAAAPIALVNIDGIIARFVFCIMMGVLWPMFWFVAIVYFIARVAQG